MNKIIHPLVLLVISFFIFSGCKKNEDTTPIKNNHILYEGKEYELSKGFSENYGMSDFEPNVYSFSLILLSSGLNEIENTKGRVVDLEGQGHGISFELNTTNVTELANGTYKYSKGYKANLFRYASYVINFSTNSSTDKSVDILEGELTVNKVGSDYEFTFACKDENGKAISGYYKGPLKMYDYR